MHFQQIFSFVSQVRYLFYHTRKRLSRLFSNFIKKFLSFLKKFEKSFWAFCEFAIQKSICALLTFYSFLDWKTAWILAFSSPYSLSFSPLSRDSFIILPHFARNVNTFFEFFSFFLRFFYFHFSLPIYRIFSISFI